MQAAVALDEVHDVLDPLPNAVANDQEQELAAFEVAADVVDEARLLQVGVPSAGEFVQDIARASEGPRDLPLQVLVAPGRELLGVVQDLPDDLAARQGIPPELVFREDQSSQRIDVHRVHVPRGCRQLAADRDRPTVRSVDRLHRERVREIEEEVPEGRLVHAALSRGRAKGNPAENFSRAAAGRIHADQAAVRLILLAQGFRSLVAGKWAGPRVPRSAPSAASRERESRGRGGIGMEHPPERSNPDSRVDAPTQ